MLLMESRTILTMLFIDFLLFIVLLNIVILIPWQQHKKIRNVLITIATVLFLIFGGMLTYFIISPMVL